MYDASGRYPSQFLFGNDYWLGSKTLCEELTNNETNKEIPDFQVQFYVAKVRISIDQNLTPVVRILNNLYLLSQTVSSKFLYYGIKMIPFITIITIIWDILLHTRID